MSMVCETESPATGGVSERLDLVLDQARRQARAGTDFPEIEQYLMRHVIRKPVLNVDAGGIRYLVYPNSTTSDVAHGAGSHSSTVSRFCDRVLQPGMTVFDLGFSGDLFPLRCGQLVHEFGRVVVFPANRESACRLRDNMALNALSNVHVQLSCLDQEAMQISPDQLAATSQLDRIDMIRVPVDPNWQNLPKQTERLRTCDRIGAILFVSAIDVTRSAIDCFIEQWSQLGWTISGISESGALVPVRQMMSDAGFSFVAHQASPILANAMNDR